VLLERHVSEAELLTLALSPDSAPLTSVEHAAMRFARKVVEDATSVSAEDVAELRDLGLSDPEIFDIAAAAAARCFFSKTLDALGVAPDAAYTDLPSEFREALTVGRPIETE
jgi:alkylhydroperoxidase family enzyme